MAKSRVVWIIVGGGAAMLAALGAPDLQADGAVELLAVAHLGEAPAAVESPLIRSASVLGVSATTTPAATTAPLPVTTSTTRPSATTQTTSTAPVSTSTTTATPTTVAPSQPTTTVAATTTSTSAALEPPATVPPPASTTTAAPPTPPPTTQPAPAPTVVPLPRHEAIGQEAMGRLFYDWRAQLPGWTVTFLPGRSGLLGGTYPAQKAIEIYVRDDASVGFVAHVLAHEMGHAVDVSLNTTEDRNAWLDARGFSLNTGWFVGDGQTDFSSGAGDFAESFAAWQLGPSDFRSTLSGPPNGAQLETIAALAAG